jgi:hypothetical protein
MEIGPCLRSFDQSCGAAAYARGQDLLVRSFQHYGDLIERICYCFAIPVIGCCAVAFLPLSFSRSDAMSSATAAEVLLDWFLSIAASHETSGLLVIRRHHRAGWRDAPVECAALS